MDTHATNPTVLLLDLLAPAEDEVAEDGCVDPYRVHDCLYCRLDRA